MYTSIRKAFRLKWMTKNPLKIRRIVRLIWTNMLSISALKPLKHLASAAKRNSIHLFKVLHIQSHMCVMRDDLNGWSVCNYIVVRVWPDLLLLMCLHVRITRYYRKVQKKPYQLYMAHGMAYNIYDYMRVRVIVFLYVIKSNGYMCIRIGRLVWYTSRFGNLYTINSDYMSELRLKNSKETR